MSKRSAPTALRWRASAWLASPRRTFGRVALLLATLLPWAAGAPAATPDGLAGRVVVGYQGWFGCPGDFEGNREWQHWFVKSVDPVHFTVDVLPSTRGLDSSDLCDTGLTRADGSHVLLYSSQNPRVVLAHFEWMRAKGIDGVAVQRFLAATRNPAKKRRSDHVLRLVRQAAEATGRVFYLAYDVSGADPLTVHEDVLRDWRYVVEELGLTRSEAYLRDGGRLVLQLWGFGFKDRPGNPGQTLALIDALRARRAGSPAVALVGGVPANWRTLDGDSRAEREWASVYRSFDVLSPWTVGRYTSEEDFERFVRTTVTADLAEVRRLGLGYQPVIFPGFSWYNLMSNRAQPKRAILDQIPRRCGRFLDRQAQGLLALGVSTLYGAMFDEADEGTAMMPIERDERRVPVGAAMITHDRGGCTAAEDHYLRLLGDAAWRLKSLVDAASSSVDQPARNR